MPPAFAQIQPKPALHANDDTPSNQNQLTGFDAVAHQLAADLAKAGQKRAVFFDFHGICWSPFASWLADQFAISFGTADYPVSAIERAKLAAYEPIQGYVHRPGTPKNRVALELGADTIIEGVYRPASNGVGVSLSAHRVTESGDAAVIDNSPIVTVDGYIPYTNDIGTKIYLPLDALWTTDNKSAPSEQRVSGPGCIYCPNPQYSSEAHKKKVEGTVLLSAAITTDGRAIQIIVVKSLGFGLDEQAIADVNTWRFKPAMYAADHRPIPVYCLIEVVFRLY
jgi:TonB family protein